MLDYEFKVLERVKLNSFVENAWFFTFIIIVIFISIIFLPWQQTVKGEGTLVAYDPTQRDYQVVATMAGVIENFYVKENEFVTKGTKLFSMLDLDKEYLQKLTNIQNDSKDKLFNTQEQIENFKMRKDNLLEYKKVGLDVFKEKLQQIKNRIKSLEFKKVSLKKNSEVLNSNLQRVATLYNEGIESKRNFETAQNKYVKSNAELNKIDIDIEVQNNNITILEQEKKQFSTDTNNKIKTLEHSMLLALNSATTLSQDLQRHSSTIARYKRGEVVAQKDGYVVRILQNDKNKFIKKGEPIIYFSPKVTTRAVMLKVSGFNMPLIKENLEARIMFCGWPALQISGWPKIKYGTFGGIIKTVESTSHEKGFYYAQILENPNEPWPKSDILRVGTQATVWVRLSTVPIWYQLWSLMNALPPKMVTPTSMEKI